MDKNKTRYSEDELRQRAFLRVAWVIRDMWEEGSGNTNLLNNWLIPDRYVIAGASKNGGGRREHVVPRVVIYDECERMFATGRSVKEVAAFIERYLKIVHIAPEEQRILDAKYKKTMPDGWSFEDGEVYARLAAVGIEYIPLECKALPP